MAKAGLSTRRVEGIGEGSLVGTLSRLLQLTCEAVLVFDGAGRVLLANDEASELFDAPGGLVGTDVRLVFPASGDETAAHGPFEARALPFPVDGTASLVSCRGASGRSVRVRVRCETVQAPGETYLLVARHYSDDALVDREGARVLEDLRRANHRLAGTLNIVLDTLDSTDVSALFERVLEEVTDTMEADGTIVYLAETDGFHLRGISSGLAGEKVARFMPSGRSVERLAIREGHAVRLRVCAPSSGALRQGRLTTREVVNEDTHEVLKMRSDMLPPFTSFVSVPVWFGGHVIAIIEVGWRRVHPILKEEAGLLDSVAHYLSVQLAGAFTTLRAQRASRLDTLATELREELLTSATREGAGTLESIDEVFAEAADELEAALVRVHTNEHQHLAVAELPLTGARELPVSVDELVGDRRRDGVAVVAIQPDTPLFSALRGLGEPCVGALVDLGELSEHRRCFMVLRPDGAEPLDDIELDFLQVLAGDVHDIARGEEAREQDKRISQALQTGMRNELQRVDGITAQAVYSSATKAASVGGDFYDLIRLPDRRACVIMGDVSGKGVEAASVSAAVKTALGAYAWEGLSPARMVRSLNEFLLGFSRLETFATLFVGIVDLEAATIRYCSAGHPPAILIGPGADEISILDVQSGVVGAFHDINYQDGLVSLEPGDVLLLYTDGTTEARDPSGAFFGEEGLRDMVMRESEGDKPFDGFVERLLATLDAFTGRNLEDDVAMVALRFDELGEWDGAPAVQGGAPGEKDDAPGEKDGAQG
ncbi:GAF domain-containing SpoIIE family protein phosphatase [Olsenella profusa]|uniref:SpoIIE family protein phosphatase n=1 Tax=Olsenella profusa TaxID=138595 RepID=A0ABS2F1L5_9ACTN|nr:GAF domain-containing SpoIIE family protein phosphatase [Olsenella profusa]MBM6774864.1 SpoIIE family protein phosphatase [Olsenella profusa]